MKSKLIIFCILTFVLIFSSCNRTHSEIINKLEYELKIKKLTPSIYISWYHLPRLSGPVIISSKIPSDNEILYISGSIGYWKRRVELLTFDDFNNIHNFMLNKFSGYEQNKENADSGHKGPFYLKIIKENKIINLTVHPNDMATSLFQLEKISKHTYPPVYSLSTYLIEEFDLK